MRQRFESKAFFPSSWLGLMCICFVVIGSWGCSLERGSGTKKSPDDTVKMSAEDGPRPIEDSENLLGYLTDPELVAVTQGDQPGSYVITGKPDAVQTTAEDTSVKMVFWRVDTAQLGNATMIANGKLLPAEALDEIAVNADGSFQHKLTAEFAAGFVLGISVEGRHSDSSVLVREGAGNEPTVGYVDPQSVIGAEVTITPLRSTDL